MFPRIYFERHMSYLVDSQEYLKVRVAVKLQVLTRVQECSASEVHGRLYRRGL